LKFTVVSIGTEINLGLILNTNSKYIAEALTELGLECNFMITVRDNEHDIVSALKVCSSVSDIIIVSGGLGPTDDDLTREAIAKYLSRDLVRDNSLDESSLRFLKYIKNDDVTQGLLKQSLVPDGSVPIKPGVGSASGFLFQLDDGKIIFSIPGVPREMKDMFDKDVLPFIKERLVDKKKESHTGGKAGSDEEVKILRKTILLTTDISESQIEFLLKDVKKTAIEKNIEIGITANPGLIKIILISQSYNATDCKDSLNVIENGIRDILDENIYGKDDTSIGDSIKDAIDRSGMSITISTAESITGGLISSLITDTPGSSKYFKGSIIPYTDYSKKNVLGLDGKIIRSDGAVSKKVCLEMAKKAREVFNTDFAISTTGIAGPSIPEKGKDVGLVYCSIIGPGNIKEIYEKRFIGTRADIKFRTAQFILNRLRLAIIKKTN